VKGNKTSYHYYSQQDIVVGQPFGDESIMKVIHFEIPAIDTKQATDFYTKVFDWKISNYGAL
jgi:hypothetical protein